MKHIFEEKGFGRLWADNDDGFSLLELVIAVSIMLILAVVAVVGVGAVQSNARDAAVEAAAGEVYTGVSAEHHAPRGKSAEQVVTDYNASSDGITATVAQGASDVCITAVYTSRPEHSAQRGDCDTTPDGDNNNENATESNTFEFSIIYDHTIDPNMVDMNKIDSYMDTWENSPFLTAGHNTSEDFHAIMNISDVDTETITVDGVEYLTNAEPMTFTFWIDIEEQVEPDATNISFMYEAILVYSGDDIAEQFVIPLVGNDYYYWAAGLTADTAEFPWIYVDAELVDGEWIVEDNWENDMFERQTIYSYTDGITSQAIIMW